MNVRYLGALREEDAVAEGWVCRRGKSIVFGEAVVAGALSGSVVATGDLIYQVRHQGIGAGGGDPA